MSRLYDTGKDILAALQTRMDDYGRVAPARAYVHAGQVAYDAGGDQDCDEALVVQIARSYTGVPGQDFTTQPGCVFPRSGSYIVHLIRCVPSLGEAGQAPSDTELDNAAAELSDDAWALERSIIAAAKAGDIGASCDQVQLGALTPIDPQGGVAGWTLGVEVGFA